MRLSIAKKRNSKGTGLIQETKSASQTARKNIRTGKVRNGYRHLCDWQQALATSDRACVYQEPRKETPEEVVQETRPGLQTARTVQQGA
jgi:hypothetical protein